MIFWSAQDTLLTDSVAADTTAHIMANKGAPIIGETIHGVADVVHQQLLVKPGPPDWYFVFLFVLITGLAVAQFFFGNLFVPVFTSAVRFNTTVGRFKDNSLLQRQRNNILYINYFITVGFILFQLENYFGIAPMGLVGGILLLWNIAILIVLFFWRITILNITGHLFNRTATFREFLYHMFAYNKLLGLVLIPLTLLIVYSGKLLHEIMVYLTISVILASIVMKIVRGIIFSIKRDVFNFYLFLYLCALELVPILLIYKWLTSLL